MNSILYGQHADNYGHRNNTAAPIQEGQTHPRIKIKLLKKLTVILSHRLRKANRKLSVFD